MLLLGSRLFCVTLTTGFFTVLTSKCTISKVHANLSNKQITKWKIILVQYTKLKLQGATTTLKVNYISILVPQKYIKVFL